MKEEAFIRMQHLGFTFCAAEREAAVSRPGSLQATYWAPLGPSLSYPWAKPPPPPWGNVCICQVFGPELKWYTNCNSEPCVQGFEFDHTDSWKQVPHAMPVCANTASAEKHACNASEANTFIQNA